MNDELISRPTFKNRLEKKESIIETKFIAQIDPRPYNFRSNLYNLFSKIFFIPSVKIYSFPGRKEIKRKKKFTVSSIHSNQKRNPPSSTRSLPYRLDRGGHAPRFLAGLTFNRVQKRAQSFHFAQSGHSACIRSSGIGRSISSAYYAIISLTRRRGREGELSHQKW